MQDLNPFTKRYTRHICTLVEHAVHKCSILLLTVNFVPLKIKSDDVGCSGDHSHLVEEFISVPVFIEIAVSSLFS